ncbi:MAG: NADH-quinone oxidoreductase subunit L [Kofleriaceae bacterium]|jgi:NADH-quinone oxidoreductase subunit L|nr:NADH-quinone oxidoreductase subunit L [Kofleriaceae bacterium]MBP9172666.1 NADH-quinone oxidoreductase subunit L [Kofleriaceae bacterium]MBP9862852.1 NADH-quinone oxidoreductase subunit L [Kofleriaceae bacterium]
MDARDTIKFLWVVPFLPLVGAFLNLVLGRRLSRQSVHFIAVAAVAASFFTALYLVIGPLREAHGLWAKAGRTGVFETYEHLWTWMAAGDFRIDMALRLDPLSAVMILIVTGCSTLIHIYSTGYMEHEPRYAAYFGYLNLFTGAMLVLVLGANMPVMFIGWEGVGLCSFLLIGFWFENEAYANAGRKAFVVNRIGDFAFLLGMFLLWWATHEHDGGRSLDFTMLREVAGVQVAGKPLYEQTFWAREHLAAAAGILLFIGAAGKSAQLPLYVWLPDAMAGPTPVSALIHAATMVTAGVYMVARLSYLFAASTTAMAVVATVGALTALAAAFMAFAQTDLKKVLAYSTVSQLGFMFVGVGTGNWGAGIFHLMTHAFFKAGLFLGAGSVMHGMNGSGDIRIMGGLKKYMPVTRWTFLIYCLAIAGVPLTSGFFSKDEILAGAWASHHDGWPAFYGKLLWGMLTVAALGTAFYMWRLYFLVFEGPYRGAEHVEHPHESPSNMTGPLVVLAGLALIAGFVGIPHVIHVGGTLGDILHFLPNWVGLSTKPMDLHLSSGTTYALLGVASAVGLAGIALAWWLYGRGPSEKVERWTAGPLRGAYEASKNKLWVDEAYDVVFVRPFRALAKGTFEIVDRFMIDTVVVNGVGFATQTFSRIAQWVQNGQVQRYMVGIVFGAAAIFLWTAREDHPRFSYQAVPGGIEFRAEPGHGIRKDAKVQWDFDGDGKPDPGETSPVVVKRPGDVASRVTLFVYDEVFGANVQRGEPKERLRVTRKVVLPTSAAAPGGAR